MDNSSLKATYELNQGVLIIQASETRDNKSDDLTAINIALQFTSHSDGKLFECQMDDHEIQKLHQIFFDTSLILDILERSPRSLYFVKNVESVQGPKNVPGGINDNVSEVIDVVWEFTSIRTKQKSKVYPISIQIPEKKYPEGSNQQIIELNRLLTCYRQRLTDLESRYTTHIDLDIYVLRENFIHKLTMNEMQWLAFSNYGMITGLNKYFAQFKSSNDMTRQLYPKDAKNQIADMCDQHVQDWLLQNDYKFDEMLSAQFRLNKWMETNQMELIDVRLQEDINLMTIDIACGLIIHNRNLYCYSVRSNYRKPKTYVILKSTDPAPTQYETAFYLRDAYQPIKNHLQRFPLISKIDEKFEKKVTYNSQWVIYKICVQ